MRRLILARRHAVEEWVDPALLELCERPEPLNLDEARLMDFEDVVLVGSVRQNVRSPTLTTDGEGIRDCIQAWKSGEPWSPGPATVSRPPTPGTPVWSRARTPRGQPRALDGPGMNWNPNSPPGIPPSESPPGTPPTDPIPRLSARRPPTRDLAIPLPPETFPPPETAVSPSEIAVPPPDTAVPTRERRSHRERRR